MAEENIEDEREEMRLLNEQIDAEIERANDLFARILEQAEQRRRANQPEAIVAENVPQQNNENPPVQLIQPQNNPAVIAQVLVRPTVSNRGPFLNKSPKPKKFK